MFSFQIKKPDPIDYITYLNKVNEIDSIYRLKKDTLTAIKMYHDLFKNYPPSNSYLINEYQTYIILSDKYKKDFGGKKSLYKLIPLVAPNWKYNRMDKDFFILYNKYEIDSLEIEKEVNIWEKGLNKTLIDSFTIAINRDQENGRSDVQLLIKNDNKNAKLLTWTFSKYGYPSLQKIGLWVNNDVILSTGTILNHMSSTKEYPYFKEKILEYVKKGECPAGDYATMIDRYDHIHNKDTDYGTIENIPIKDSIKVNRNRKKIGMPSLKHFDKIHKDYFGS